MVICFPFNLKVGGGGGGGGGLFCLSGEEGGCRGGVAKNCVLGEVEKHKQL
jgi:hypothetical protein